MLFNRHNYLQDIIKYWSEEKPSNIGLGFFKRNEDYSITKTNGRSDLGMINHTDGKQYVFELVGFKYCNPPLEVKEKMYFEINSNMEQILRSIHFHNWLENQVIIEMPYSEIIILLQKGLNSFTYEEALQLFAKIEF